MEVDGAPPKETVEMRLKDNHFGDAHVKPIRSVHIGERALWCSVAVMRGGVSDVRMSIASFQISIV